MRYTWNGALCHNFICNFHLPVTLLLQPSSAMLFLTRCNCSRVAPCWLKQSTCCRCCVCTGFSKACTRELMTISPVVLMQSYRRFQGSGSNPPKVEIKLNFLICKQCWSTLFLLISFNIYPHVGKKIQKLTVFWFRKTLMLIWLGLSQIWSASPRSVAPPSSFPHYTLTVTSRVKLLLL